MMGTTEVRAQGVCHLGRLPAALALALLLAVVLLEAERKRPGAVRRLLFSQYSEEDVSRNYEMSVLPPHVPFELLPVARLGQAAWAVVAMVRPAWLPLGWVPLFHICALGLLQVIYAAINSHGAVVLNSYTLFLMVLCLRALLADLPRYARTSVLSCRDTLLLTVVSNLLQMHLMLVLFAAVAFFSVDLVYFTEIKNSAAEVVAILLLSAFLLAAHFLRLFLSVRDRPGCLLLAPDLAAVFVFTRSLSHLPPSLLYTARQRMLLCFLLLHLLLLLCHFLLWFVRPPKSASFDASQLSLLTSASEDDSVKKTT